jgi:PPOX class probable F420-dependent enzyme
MSSELSPARARPRARPVPRRRLPAALPLARLGAGPARRAARGVFYVPRTGTFEQIRASKHALLVTYRRDGAPVPTPAWAAADGGALYVRSERASGKVKRLRRDPRMLIAPSDARGKPLGSPLEALARVLAPEQEPRAERALAQRYGLGRVAFELAMDLLRVDMCYLEITPGEWPEETGAERRG